MKKQDEQSSTVVTVETTTFTAEEERILRMRTGAPIDSSAPLGNKLDGVAEAHRTEVATRLALIENELISQLAEVEAEDALDADRKQRIVDTLRDKDQT